MTMDVIVHNGGCLCGDVRYAVAGPLQGVVACHCSLCRRTSGHFVAATTVPAKSFTLKKADTLTWYASSENAERGFCGRCGGNLFWRQTGGDCDQISIMAGTLDLPTKLTIEQHVFVADKADYYTIDDGIPQSAGWG